MPITHFVCKLLDATSHPCNVLLVSVILRLLLPCLFVPFCTGHLTLDPIQPFLLRLFDWSHVRSNFWFMLSTRLAIRLSQILGTLFRTHFRKVRRPCHLSVKRFNRVYTG